MEHLGFEYRLRESQKLKDYNMFIFDFDGTIIRFNAFMENIFPEQVTSQHAKSALAEPLFVKLVKELVDKYNKKIAIISNSYGSVILAYINKNNLSKYFKIGINIYARNTVPLIGSRYKRVIKLIELAKIKKDSKILVFDDNERNISTIKKRVNLLSTGVQNTVKNQYYIELHHIDNTKRNNKGFNFEKDWLNIEINERKRDKVIPPRKLKDYSRDYSN